MKHDVLQRTSDNAQISTSAAHESGAWTYAWPFDRDESITVEPFGILGVELHMTGPEHVCCRSHSLRFSQLQSGVASQSNRVGSPLGHRDVRSLPRNVPVSFPTRPQEERFFADLADHINGESSDGATILSARLLATRPGVARCKIGIIANRAVRTSQR